MRILTLLALFSPSAFAGDFCVVTNYGRDCWYYSIRSCKEAAERKGGICESAPDRRQPKTLTNTDRWNNTLQSSGEMALEIGRSLREHKALQLEKEAIAAQKEMDSVRAAASDSLVAERRRLHEIDSLKKAMGFEGLTNEEVKMILLERFKKQGITFPE